MCAGFDVKTEIKFSAFVTTNFFVKFEFDLKF